MKRAFDIAAMVGIVAGIMMFVAPGSPGPAFIAQISQSLNGVMASTLGAVRKNGPVPPGTPAHEQPGRHRSREAACKGCQETGTHPTNHTTWYDENNEPHTITCAQACA